MNEKDTKSKVFLPFGPYCRKSVIKIWLVRHALLSQSRQMDERINEWEAIFQLHFAGIPFTQDLLNEKIYDPPFWKLREGDTDKRKKNDSGNKNKSMKQQQPPYRWLLWLLAKIMIEIAPHFISSIFSNAPVVPVWPVYDPIDRSLLSFRAHP